MVWLEPCRQFVSGQNQVKVVAGITFRLHGWKKNLLFNLQALCQKQKICSERIRTSFMHLAL